MGRGRGKGKKQFVIAGRDDTGSGGDDEKLPVRRRGRPQKSMKDDIDEEDEVEVEKMEEEDDELSKSSNKSQASVENGRKRKKPTQTKDSTDLVPEKNGIVAEAANSTALIKNVGYRQNGSRRKNKPRRAAEVGVECR